MAGVAKHGGCMIGQPTKEYKAYQHIKQRVKNPSSYAYGLEVGFSSFQDFIDHIGLCPDPKMSVDRIDNDKGYIHGNVRWANRETQNNNNRANVITVDTPKGVMSLKKACREYGRPYMKMYHDVKRGIIIDWEQ